MQARVRLQKWGKKKKPTLKTDIETPRQEQTNNNSVSADSRIDVILQRCVIMKYAAHPLTCVAIKRAFITLILTDMTPSDHFITQQQFSIHRYSAEPHSQTLMFYYVIIKHMCSYDIEDRGSFRLFHKRSVL